MSHDSSLHLDREDSFKDLFDLMQPRSWLDDLIRDYGVREGAVHTNPTEGNIPSSSSAILRMDNSGTGSASTSKQPNGPVTRTIVDVARMRDEKLEVTAKKLVRQLKVWLSEG
ncbi:hypothetical protein AZE42_10363 [Rhizopogon vesiculosus]|uniref:Uncharacterized protein n=1 Tax=Rhizopogon vesiculosus TaxID=180088 RepID=A0A1J8PXT9_9AGAM|nr:hypothetical protein AZE42_10363 [Rhizopogon vesiculosus]